MSIAVLPKVLLFTDGASRGNPGPAAIGVVLCDPYEEALTEHRETIGRATNNEAEYRALRRGLELAAGHTHNEVRCHVDSQLVARQLTGEYRIRKPHLAKLADRVREAEAPFTSVTYEQVPRTHPKIQRADALANWALDERYGAR